MATVIGARSNENRDIQVVAVTAVNIPERKAECMTRIRSMIYVDISYPVGGIYITPSVGDQWYVERIDTIWRLFGRIPFNDNNIQVDPVEGQQVFGGTGPVVMNGSTLDIRSPLQMNPVPDDEMPDPADMPPGTIIYSETQGLVVSDGSGEWVPTGGGGDIEDIEGLTELLDNKIDKPLVPLVPGTGTKISYDENGLVIGGDDADITDITDLDTTLEGKSDVGHGHTEAEIINLEIDLASKAAVDHTHSEDGAALDPDLVDIGALTPANSDFIQRVADHWTNVPPSAVKGGLDLSFLDISGVLDDLQIPGLDCTKITGGTFLQSLIPTLPANWITGTFVPGQIPDLNASKITAGFIDLLRIPTMDTGHIPNLDANKITSGFLDLLRIPTMDTGHIPNLSADKITTGVLNLLRIPGLDVGRIPSLPAGQITSGTFLDTLIPNLQADKITSGVFNLLRIPGLDVSRIPSLPAGQITSGTFPQSMLDITNIASSIVSGSFLSSQIPLLDVTKIIGGPFDTGMIPSLNASKITAGTLLETLIPTLTAGKIPDLNASKITAGVLDLLRIPGLDVGRIPDLDANKITTGILNLLRIPGLDLTRIPSLPAGQITSGTFTDAFVPGLGATRDAIYQAIYGGTTTGITTAQTKTALQNIPGGNIVSALLATVIPSLDASKIGTGTFGTTFIPNLDAAKITTGTFPQSMLNITSIAAGIISGALAAGNIPALDASKITTGSFVTGLIPNLDAAKITSGTFGTGLIPILDAATKLTGLVPVGSIPGLDGSKITSGKVSQSFLDITSIASGIITGTLLAANIPALDTSKITTGTFGTSFIPNLDTAKITTGVLDLLRIPGLDAGRIPVLDTSKITTGTFGATFIPNLDAAKITTGLFGRARLGVGDFENLAAGSDFEGTHPWTLGTNVTVATDQFNTGTKSLKMGAPNTGAVLQGVFETKPGEQFYLELWARRDAAYNGTSGNAKLRLGGLANANVGQLAYGVTDLPTPDVWVKLATTVPAMPAGTTSLVITLGGDSTAGNVWLDDIIIRRIKPPSAIAGLPASQITSGAFAQSFVTGLPAMANLVTYQSRVGSNFANSPDFETVSMWPAPGFSTSWAGAITTEQSHGGTRSVKITSDGVLSQDWYFTYDPTTTGRSNVITKPGEKFTCSFWYYVPATNVGSTNNCIRLIARFGDSKGVNAAQFPGFYVTPVVKGAWTLHEATFTTPAGYDQFTVAAGVALNATAFPAGDVFYFDDIVARETTMSSNIIAQLFGGTSILPAILATTVPALDTSKITTGTFAQTFVTGLPGLSAAFLGNRAGGTNLASDPDASRNDLWLQGSGSGTGCTTIVSTEQSLSGTTSVKITASGTADFGVDLRRTTAGGNALSANDDGILHVQPGDKFYAEAYGRVHAAVTATKSWYITFGAMDSKGVNPTLNSTATQVFPTSSGWTKFSSEYTVLAGYDRLRVRFYASAAPAGAVGDIYYVDNMVIKEVTPQRDLASAITAAMGGSGSLPANVQTALGAIPGANIASAIAAAIIPGLDASKITGGEFPQSMITGLAASLAAGGQAFGDAIVAAMGGTGSGYTPAEVQSALENIPGPNIISELSDTIIPLLDVTKIIGGPFTTGMIPDLNASKITAGFIDLLRIPTLTTGHVPDLNASKITAGNFAQDRITNLPTDLANRLLTSVFNSKARAGSNLVIDPTFEDTTITRLLYGTPAGGYDTAQKHSGARSYRWVHGDNATSWGIYLQHSVTDSVIRTKPGDKFYIEVWVYPHASNVLVSNAYVQIYGRFTDSNGVNANAFFNAPASGSAAQTTPQMLPGQWNKLYGYATVPAGYDGFNPMVVSTPTTTIGNQFYLDDVIVREVTESQNITQQLYGGTSVLGTILDTAIPGLQTTKIVGGTFSDSFVPGLANRLLTNVFDTRMGSDVSNLVISPNFENTTILRPGAGSYSTEQSHGGTTSWKVAAITGSQQDTYLMGYSTTVTQHHKTSPGDKFYGEIWCYPLAANTGNGLVGFFGYCRDSKNVLPNTFPTFTPIAAPIKGQWNKLSGYITVPAGYDLIAFQTSVRVGNLTGDFFYFDDVVIREVTASQNIIGQLYGGSAILPAILPTAVPDLNASKITAGVLDLLRIPGLDVGRIPDLNANKITGGTFPQSMIDNLTTNLGSIFTTITSPTKSELLQNVPVSSIGQFNPEMLTNPTYDSAASVLGGSTAWVYDPTVTHTAGGTGSAKVVADPTIQQLLSDPPIPVSPNQILAVSHWLQWSALTRNPGVAFTLGVVAYLGNGISNTINIQSITTPALSSGWVQLSGTYTVPASGVDNIRLQLIVESNVTAGTIWWDDGSVKKTQLLRQDWTNALVGDLSNLLSGVNARTLITDTTALMSTLGLGTATLTAIGDRLANLGTGGLFDSSKLNNIAGIPMVPNTKVSGIGGIADIGGSLQQTWDQVSGAAVGQGTLAKILTRLTNLNTTGLFNASQLTNVLNIPLLPMGAIPPLDATLLQFGKVPIGQLPIGNLPTDLNRITLPDIGDTLDQMTNAWIGAITNPYTSTDPGQARQSMDSFYKEFLNLSQKMQDIRSEQTAIDVSGTSVTFNFQQYPDGPAPPQFSINLSGAGTSAWGIKSGGVGWTTAVNNGNRTCTAVYNAASTATNFQIVRGTLSGIPPGDNGGSKPRIAAIGRVDNPANPLNYVWARGYNDGFLTYKGDIGCTVNGVETVWQSGIPLTWSMDINAVFGVGGNPRRYQVFSGTQLVVDLIEPGTASKLNNGTTDPPGLYRYWGVRSELKTDSGKAIAPPSIVGCSVSDNAPPSVVGSTFRAYRASTGSVNFNGWNQTPNNFFDTPAYRSSEMGWDGTNLTVGIEGTYLVNIRYAVINLGGQERADVSVFKNHAPIRKMGGMWSYNSYEGNMFGTALVYLKVNEILTPGYSSTDTVSVSGEPGGTDTFFEVTLVNRSTA